MLKYNTYNIIIRVHWGDRQWNEINAMHSFTTHLFKTHFSVMGFPAEFWYSLLMFPVWSTFLSYLIILDLIFLLILRYMQSWNYEAPYYGLDPLNFTCTIDIYPLPPKIIPICE
jgi:hypothetical protein